MRRLYLCLVVLLIPLSSSQAANSPGASFDAGFSNSLLERGIRLAIQESPNDYIAAVVESTGAPPECEERDHKQICRSRVRVLEMLAAKPSFDLEEFYLMGGSEPWSSSDRILLFAIPMPDLGNGYGATYMSDGTARRAVEQCRSVLKNVLGN